MFERELRKDKISGWRWLLGAWGVGTYRQNDSVDVRYEAADGSPRVAEGLEIELRRRSLRATQRSARQPSRAGPRLSHGRASFSAPTDRARGGRAVERVEVDAGRAGGEQLGALQGGVGHAEVEHRLGLILARVQLAAQARRGSRRRTSSPCARSGRPG